MSKKIILAGIFFITNACFAASDVTTYVGGGIGKNLSSQSGVIFNALAGYGKRLGDNKKIYLGGEMAAHYNTHHAYGIGASFLPGYMLSDTTMLYGKIGLDSTHSHNKHANFPNVLSFNTQLGVGLQTAVAKNVDMRGEFVTSGFGSHAVNLGLIYKLN